MSLLWKIATESGDIEVHRGVMVANDMVMDDTAVNHVHSRSQREGYGTHWTTDPKWAHAYSQGALRSTEVDHERPTTGVVVHATVSPEHIDPTSRRFSPNADSFDKSEVVLKKGAPVKVHGYTATYSDPTEEYDETPVHHPREAEGVA
jgi:hypothetical protein